MRIIAFYGWLILIGSGSFTAGAPVEAQSLSPLTREAKAAPYISTVECLHDFHRAFAGDFRYYISSLDTNQNGDTTSTVLVTVEDANSERRTFQIAPGTLKVHLVKGVEPIGNAVKVTILSAESGKDEQVLLTFNATTRQLLVSKAGLPPAPQTESTVYRRSQRETAPPAELDRTPDSKRTPEAKIHPAIEARQQFSEAAKNHGANEIADVNVQFSQGRFYQIVNVKVAQVGDGFVLTTWDAYTEDKPFAVLTFKNPAPLNDFNLAGGAYIRAVGAFLKFKAFTMTGGSSQRLPVFECVGIEVNGKFIKTD